MKRRTLVIGDIHGGLKALQEVLIKSTFNFTKDRLICLGDYVDGWSESAGVLDLLINLKHRAEYAGNGDNIIFIKGNHDEWCREWMNSGNAQHIWVNQGGRATIHSYVELYNGIIPDEHRDFMNKLHNYYVDEENRGFVHGGFTSRKGLGHEAHESSYYWDRDMWQLSFMAQSRVHFDEDGTPQANRFYKHKEVYIGHTATTMWNCKPHYPEFHMEEQKSKNGQIVIPMNRCNVWNLDTGGGWGGKLTIMDIDTKEFWQSDYVKDLYPNEKGR